MLTCPGARCGACVDAATLALAVVAVGLADILTDVLATWVAWLLVGATLVNVVLAVVALGSAALAVVALTGDDDATDDTTDGFDAVGAPQATSSATDGSPIAADAVRERKSRRLQGRCDSTLIVISPFYPVCHSIFTRKGTPAHGVRMHPDNRRAIASSSQLTASRGSPRSAGGKITRRPLRCEA